MWHQALVDLKIICVTLDPLTCSAKQMPLSAMSSKAMTAALIGLHSTPPCPVSSRGLMIVRSSCGG